MCTGPGLALCGSTWPRSPHSVPLRGGVGRCGGPGPLEKVAVEGKASHSSSCPLGREHHLPRPFPSPPQPTPELPQDPLTWKLHGALEGKEARLLLMNQALVLGQQGWVWC